MQKIIIYTTFFCCFYFHIDSFLQAQSHDYPPHSPSCRWETSSFFDFKTKFLQSISKTQNIVWLISNYLTDGDIVASLFLASYRKLDVRVLLNIEKAHDYMSRLQYLREQNIPVYARPLNLYDQYATILITDTEVLVSKMNLDFLNTSNYFCVIDESKNLQTFKQAFIKAFEQNTIIPKNVNSLNKAIKSYSKIKATHNIPKYNYYTETNTEVYNYDKYPPQITNPEYIPKKLPKQLMLQDDNSNTLQY